MKKRILTTLALVLLVAMCALTFAACTPTDVGKYMAAIKKADHCTIESVSGDRTMTIAIDGKNVHMKVVEGTETGEIYVIADGDKRTMYMFSDGKWTKTEVAEDIDEYADMFDLKNIKEGLEVDEAKYDIKDGVWTEKDGGESYKVEKGKLVIFKGETTMGSYSIAKPTIKLPKEAKDAKVAE